ncbi:hypothetical protein OB959_18180 [Aeromonas bestiarum]|uniref:Uncharacterized protein n=1 Tax=Aeromonas bestiarum TaxID=105751 RepID=A0AAW7I1P2_9GAMM|nr:hypothetical protein [Aeromonas bestiarum]MDM5141701.1 hypothetical protein [Aeromonas bestiarum]
MALGPNTDAEIGRRLAKAFRNSFPWTARFTHIHLLSGLKGREVSRNDGEVVIENEKGMAQAYDEDKLHLTWAPLDRDSQGENT